MIKPLFTHHVSRITVNLVEANQIYEVNSEVFRLREPEFLDAWTFGKMSGAELGLEIWRRTLHSCGYDDPSLAQVAIETHLQFARETYLPYADVAGLLEMVQQVKVPVALITNGASDTQREKIDALGITTLFSAFAISGEMEVAKPDVAAFAPALEALDVSGKQVWHVGDNLATDVAGANAASLTSVWLNRNGSTRDKDDPKPDVEIASLSELTSYLLR